MSYICKHCGNRHNKASTAQECAESAERVKGVYPSQAELPDGNYLINLRDDGNKLFRAHVIVRQFTGSRWGGRYLVNVVNDEGAVTAVTSPQHREYLLRQIRSFGFRQAMLNYGRTKELCPICDQRMTTVKEVGDGVHAELRCYSIVFG